MRTFTDLINFPTFSNFSVVTARKNKGKFELVRSDICTNRVLKIIFVSNTEHDFKLDVFSYLDAEDKKSKNYEKTIIVGPGTRKKSLLIDLEFESELEKI